jgi:hypothetical protein
MHHWRGDAPIMERKGSQLATRCKSQHMHESVTWQRGPTVSASEAEQRSTHSTLQGAKPDVS